MTFPTQTYPGSLLTPPFMPSGEEGGPATITGILRLPGGAERVPAVIITHCCSGLTGAETFWGRYLRSLGIATLAVNSIGGRDMPRFCSGRHTMSTASLLTDVYRGEFFSAHPSVDASRIALMGFSLGGRTALWASHLRFEQRYGGGSHALLRISRFIRRAATSRWWTKSGCRTLQSEFFRGKRTTDRHRSLPRVYRPPAQIRKGRSPVRLCWRQALVRQS